MNTETKQFLENEAIRELFERLSGTHKPIKPEFDSDRLQALGLVFVRFQRLEFTVRHLIGALSGLSGNQRMLDIVTVKHSFKSLLAVLQAVSIEVGFLEHEDLNQLIAHSHRAEQIRNQLIHSVWTSGPRMKADIKPKKGLTHKFEDYSADELNQIASQIDMIDTSMEAMMLDSIRPESTGD